MTGSLSSQRSLTIENPYAKELLEALLPYSKVKRYQAGQRLSFIINSDPVCYLVVKGSVSYYRRNTNILLGTVDSPAIFGIAAIHENILAGYLRTTSICIIASIPRQQVYDIIKEKDLWKALSNYLMVITNKLYVNGQQLTAPGAYEKIRIQLNQLMDEAPALRQKMTAELYIREKTNLSRSRVMHILSELRAGGYIELERGRLVAIHKLPEHF